MACSRFCSTTREKYTEIDSPMVVLAAYVCVVDCVQLWRIGQPGRGLFRLVASWGFCGLWDGGVDGIEFGLNLRDGNSSFRAWCCTSCILGEK